MDKIGFVVLHYNTYDETIACINSIVDMIDTQDYEIIVVDNASPNGSGEFLRKKYSKRTNVTVILNKENVGFSRGNNIGFRYAKNDLGCNYIILSNNDILIRSNNFLSQLRNDYYEYSAAVIGPKVFTFGDDIGTQNPQWKAVATDAGRIEKLQKKKKDLNFAIALSYVNFDDFYLTLKEKVGKLVRKHNRVDVSFFSNIQMDVQLHGCFLAFTPGFVENYDGLDEVTFMYHEEMILRRKMEKGNQLMMYDPALQVFHAEKAATRSVARTVTKSRRIRYRRELASVNDVIAFLHVEYCKEG